MDAKPSIVCIAKDPLIIRQIGSTLEDDGFPFFSASNAQDGLDLVRARGPGVVLLDCYSRFPDFGGRVLTAMQDDVALASIPVIAICIRSRDDLTGQVAAFLYSPIGVDELLACIRAVLADEAP
jgi:DNA-binding response OmpR family regulator